MKVKKSMLALAVGMGMLSALPTAANAHGWSEYPSARQNTCYEQGGVWSGSPPNAACAQAKEISGTYPFVQRNEYAMNIKDYNNIEAVKAAIPDGTLCFANDPQKAGMGAPHSAWSRTSLNPGTFEYVFNATAPHNPSFWEFYLTKPNADLSQALAWDDLELIQTEGNVPVESGKYRINVTIPSERSGDAILFVRWQRADPAGEGFYNCSDITIVNGDTTPPPEPTPEPDLVKGNLYIPQGFVAPEVGDTVKYDIINKHGEVARSFDIDVTTNNLNDWERLLASQINGWHAEFKDGAVFIGDWHEEMSHYMYFQDQPARNFFNSRDSRASGVISVIEGDDNIEPLQGAIYELVASDKVVNSGDKVVIALSETSMLSQTQGTPVSIENNGTSTILVDTTAVTQNETLSFVAQAMSNERSQSFTFEVVTEDEGVIPEPGDNAWDQTTTYLGGEVVTYGGQKWKAQWWVQGGEDPQTTYNNDQWGVWRPVK